MSQRLLFSHSALFTKGVALKAGDWRNHDVTDAGPQDNTMMRRSESVTSIASLQKQFNIQRVSSSSLASNIMIKSRSYPASLNSFWNDKESSISLPNQTESTSTSSIDLYPVKTDETSEIHPANRVVRSSLPEGSIQFPKEASRHTIRSRPSMPNLSSLVEEKEEEGSFNPISQRLSSLFDFIALKTDGHFKIHHPSTTGKSSCPENSAKETERHSLRSRLSMPNMSSLVEEEEVLFKQYQFRATNNNTKVIAVSTFSEKVPRHLDIRNISSSDLALLKEDDPFMYYSIPAVRNATRQGEHVDLQKFQDSDFSSTDSSIYERKSRISFESWNLPSPSNVSVDDTYGCYIPSLGGAFFDFNMDDDEEDEDPIDDFLLMSSAGGIVQSPCR